MIAAAMHQHRAEVTGAAEAERSPDSGLDLGGLDLGGEDGSRLELPEPRPPEAAMMEALAAAQQRVRGLEGALLRDREALAASEAGRDKYQSQAREYQRRLASLEGDPTACGGLKAELGAMDLPTLRQLALSSMGVSMEGLA